MCNLSCSTAQMSLSRIAEERGGGRVFSSSVSFANWRPRQPWESMESLQQSLKPFLFLWNERRRAGRGFLALHFLSLLKHPQRTGLGACIKHVAMPQPQAPLLLWLCKWSFVEWESQQHGEPGSCHPLTKVPWSPPHCRVCFQLEVNKGPFSVPVSGILVTSHCPWLSCF